MSSIDWQTYRNLFPHLRDQIYLNHAAIAPMNLSAYAALQEFCSHRLEKDVEFWSQALDSRKAFLEKIG
ncbi:MAG: hypothetical protein EH225_10520, partial [Calditrichaeota bacterium]